MAPEARGHPVSGRSRRAGRVVVLSSLRDVADARLHRLVEALVATGLDVRVEATGDAETGPLGAEVVTKARPGKVARFGRSLVAPLRSTSDVLVVTDPDLFAPALLARRLGRTRAVVVDVYEDYAAVLRDRSWATGVAGAVGGVIARVGRWAARRADLTLVADAHVPPLTARHRLVVPNLPALDDLPPPTDGHDPRAVYVGDVRASRGALTMIEAVASAPPWTLDVIGPLSDPADRAEIEAAAAACDRVRLHGRLPLGQAWQAAADASVGFSLLADTPAYRAAMPTKIYEYLGAGKAVLTSPLPRPAELIRGSGGGAVVSSSAEAADMLRRWHERPTELASVRRRARQWAEATLDRPTPFESAAAEIRRVVDDIVEAP